MLRRSTHGPARRSHAPRRATRGPWPRLRYRLIARLVAAPSAPLTLRAGQPRFAGPPAPLTLRPSAGPARCRSSARPTLGLRRRSARRRSAHTPADRSTRPSDDQPPRRPSSFDRRTSATTGWLFRAFPCRSRSGPRASLRRRNGGRSEKLAPTQVPGGVASSSSGQSPIADDFSALTAADFGGRG